ncbi:nucleotide disphospho-sugar-binding domain-containing protein [Actinoallomurus sp. CA-150999]|uniref:nucleotide disphospho-sugar-binding domain-containing protein n=1 Tax=Actinoallomurus sp. CA-150999 TaxID=3239887 RepID=UPI003D8A4135
MRIIATAIWPTHLMAMVPTAWALRAAGHQVVVAATRPVADAAEGTGLPTRTIAMAELAAQRPTTPGALGHRPAAGAGAWQWSTEVLAERAKKRVAALLDDFLRFGRSWQPDLILSDPMEWNALIVAGALGVPVVHHRWGPDLFTQAAREAAADVLAPACRDVGLRGGLPEPDLVVDPCPPSLQSPHLPPAEPVRYIPYNGAGQLIALPPRRPGVRRVLVSLGMSIEAAHPVLLERIIQAVGTRPDVEAVVTVPPRLRSRFTDVPAGVRIVDPVPINLLLGDCDAVVHHGGSGTAQTSCAFGLPQLCVLPADEGSPAFPALAVCADRIAATGAGRVIDAPHDPDAISAGLDDILGRPGYRAAAERLRAEIDTLPPPAGLVAVLEKTRANGANVCE